MSGAAGRAGQTGRRRGVLFFCPAHRQRLRQRDPLGVERGQIQHLSLIHILSDPRATPVPCSSPGITADRSCCPAITTVRGCCSPRSLPTRCWPASGSWSPTTAGWRPWRATRRLPRRNTTPISKTRGPGRTEPRVLTVFAALPAKWRNGDERLPNPKKRGMLSNLHKTTFYIKNFLKIRTKTA